MNFWTGFLFGCAAGSLLWCVFYLVDYYIDRLRNRHNRLRF